MRSVGMLLASCVLLWAAAFVHAAESRPVGAAASARPNILFIFIDDMGCADFSCFGATGVKTPNVDKLAAEGMRFGQFYVNAPICSPSRVAVTTGQYPNRWQITSFLAKRVEDRRRGIADWLKPEAPSLARILARAGYYTAHVGKWHMGGQRDVGNAPPISAYGFATSLTSMEGLGERVLALFEPLPNGKPFQHGPTLMSAELGGGPIHWIKRHEVTAFFVDRALAEIKRAAAKGQPFYINLWPDDVHSPCQAPPGMRGDGSPLDHYRGVLRELDRQLGRVFDYIRSEPALKENTIILVASDNGPELGLGSAGDLRGGKGMLYEGGIRSPLVVWSGRIADAAVGAKNNTTVLAGMDLAPSLLALANVPVPQGVCFDGLDMSKALVGQSSPKRDGAVMWVRPPDRPGPDNNRWPDLAIREGNWKLLTLRDSAGKNRDKHLVGRGPELYDISVDHRESNNLADKHPDLVQRLAEKVIAWDKSLPSRPAD